ncbi:MAG: YbhB/YbcL family Raf kinase inhibitor-like protein [Pantoea sp.]|uniref:YbhB/YbcL family Raf kinase inhibitor-like protein n=1 Tax=Pantoea sp. TaxID=69393 RepID=UPI0023996A5B|nr:YbhB/YbcL family Raf kinase inhibitor-like protein [Pantoea sp.]MDE1190265.1 YbhB/YbcL family Raf kinase inhibitor-like protein [Pantoea sp.]
MLLRAHAGLLAGLMFCSAGALAAPFTLHSTDFRNAGHLPLSMGGGGQCPGQNISPQLSWRDAPTNTKSYVLLVEDPQGMNGLGMTHFLGYGIDSSRHQFAKGDLTRITGYTPGSNGKNVQGYSGPCPPLNGDIHNYNFTLIATDFTPDALTKGLTRDAVMAQLKGHVLASAGLVGQFILPKK